MSNEHARGCGNQSGGWGDHFPAADSAFMARVDLAIDVVRDCPGQVALLGIEPHRRETQYATEPGDLMCRGGAPTYRVRRFREKSSFVIAEAADVVVAEPRALRNLIAEAVPPLAQVMAAVDVRIGAPWESEAARAADAQMPAVDLSRDVLQPHAERLAVMPVSSAVWDDVGEPRRAIAARTRLTFDIVTA